MSVTSPKPNRDPDPSLKVLAYLFAAEVVIIPAALLLHSNGFVNASAAALGLAIVVAIVMIGAFARFIYKVIRW